MGFTKLDERILQSSIMAEPPDLFPLDNAGRQAYIDGVRANDVKAKK